MSTLKETKLSSKIIFQGRLLDVRKDEVELPNGRVDRPDPSRPSPEIAVPGSAAVVDTSATALSSDTSSGTGRVRYQTSAPAPTMMTRPMAPPMIHNRFLPADGPSFDDLFVPAMV